jgi:hypothetical protein
MSDIILRMKVIVKNDKLNLNNDYDVEANINLSEFDSFQSFLTALSDSLNFKVCQRYYNIKIFYEGFWAKLIDLKSFYFFISWNVNNKSQVMLLITKKTNEEVDYERQFENEDEMMVNKLNMNIYNTLIEPEVFCCFCNYSSLDKDMIIKVGHFYGPLHDKQKRYYFHHLCAIWREDTELDENNNLKGLLKGIKESKRLKCTYCGEYGAIMGCTNKKCYKIYHYLCAKSDDCHLNKLNYQCYCKDHKKVIVEEEINTYIEEKPKKDINDQYCIICRSGSDEDKTLVCDSCEEVIHTYCCTPEIIDMPGPDDDFFCFICIEKGKGKYIKS